MFTSSLFHQCFQIMYLSKIMFISFNFCKAEVSIVLGVRVFTLVTLRLTLCIIIVLIFLFYFIREVYFFHHLWEVPKKHQTDSRSSQHVSLCVFFLPFNYFIWSLQLGKNAWKSFVFPLYVKKSNSGSKS